MQYHIAQMQYKYSTPQHCTYNHSTVSLLLLLLLFQIIFVVRNLNNTHDTLPKFYVCLFPFMSLLQKGKKSYKGCTGGVKGCKESIQSQGEARLTLYVIMTTDGSSPKKKCQGRVKMF